MQLFFFKSRESHRKDKAAGNMKYQRQKKHNMATEKQKDGERNQPRHTKARLHSSSLNLLDLFGLSKNREGHQTYGYVKTREIKKVVGKQSSQYKRHKFCHQPTKEG